MSKVVFSISISLEGSSPGPTEPKAVAEAGAVIVGRRTYDDSIRWWGADGPTGATRLPTFVVTHQPPESSPEGGVYAFVDGVEAAIEQAKTAAGDKTVAMGGGADSAWQAIRDGLVDEISLAVVPLLLGGGTRLFGELDEPIGLEQIAVDETEQAAHVRYRLVS